MATKGNMTLRIEPELKKQAAVFVSVVGHGFRAPLRAFFTVRHCAIMDCRLKFVWTSRTTSLMQR